MAGKKFAFLKGSAKGKFSVRADDGTAMDDISMDDLMDALDDGHLDDALSARGYRLIPGTGKKVQLGVKTSATSGPFGVQLDALVCEEAKRSGITPEQARQRVLLTAQGEALWEQKRLEELRQSRVIS